MNKKTYKIIVIVATVIAVIGLISFVGGIQPVNIGAFIFLRVSLFGLFINIERIKYIKR